MLATGCVWSETKSFPSICVYLHHSELLWELQQDLDVAGGLLHCLSHSGQVLLQSSACKSLLLLSRQSLPADGLTVEMTALYVATGEEAGTAVWEHIRNQEQEQHEPHGVRKNVIVSPGDEQRTKALATAMQRNSIFQGLQVCLGLVWSKPLGFGF